MFYQQRAWPGSCRAKHGGATCPVELVHQLRLGPSRTMSTPGIAYCASGQIESAYEELFKRARRLWQHQAHLVSAGHCVVEASADSDGYLSCPSSPVGARLLPPTPCPACTSSTGQVSVEPKHHNTLANVNPSPPRARTKAE
eukprot:3293749-Rhodomonas_salina.2